MSESRLTPESPATDRMPEIIRLLHEEYPDAQCELNFETPLELLVATILSAQCTDVSVNQVTPQLFDKYPDAQAYADADMERTAGGNPVHRLLSQQGEERAERRQAAGGGV